MVYVAVYFFFFFSSRRRHTRCSRDWSSDVCSSDLYYRNGQLREEMPLRKGQRHGTVRAWHKNGVLASEEPYRDGLLHGVSRQWNESGKLLGEYRMVHGTGIQRSWHDNGRLQLEVSTVRGEFCGRNRIWLRDVLIEAIQTTNEI